MSPLTDQSGNTRLTQPVLLALVGFAALCVCAVFGLVFEGRDATQIVYLFTAVISGSSIFGAVVSRQVKAASDTAEANNEALKNIQSQVNGKLDAKFAEVHSAISDVTTATSLQVDGIHNRLNEVSDKVDALASPPLH